MSYENPNIESSYRQNDLGRTLYDCVMEWKPKRIVEYGVLNGYSTIAMAQALRDLGEGKVIAYDIWEVYPYKHATMAETQKNIDAYGLTDFVELRHGEPFCDTEADMMHLDVSNTGDFIKLAEVLLPEDINVVFEGGSRERDEVEWMKKYNKTPINDNGINFIVLNELFPSLSLLVSRKGS